MQKCLNQKRTCDLKENESCFTEIRRQGQGMVVNRGCLTKRNCLDRHFQSLRYDPNQDLLAANGWRPRQQCRHFGIAIAEGQTRFDGRKIKNSQKCVSCHQSSMSVPYF